MAELANCSRCGTVFAKTIRDICKNCYDEEEKAYHTVYDFLRVRENRLATMLEIIEATGVKEEYIIKFVREKRLLPKDVPNLAYPCERCGRDISAGHICESCQKELKNDLAAFEKEEQNKEDRKKIQSTYIAVDKHKY